MNEIQFTQLVKLYHKLIFTVCYRFIGDYQEAENLTQETFLTALRTIDNFIGDYYKAWLVKIATNKCKDYLKSSYVKSTNIIEDEKLEMIPDQQNIHKEIEYNEKITLIKKACDSLGEPYSQVAVMHFIEEKNFNQIANELELPIKTVQTRSYRARDKLRVLLKEVIYDA